MRVPLLALALVCGCSSKKERAAEPPPTTAAPAPAPPSAPPPPPAPLPPLPADPGGATGAPRWLASFGGPGSDGPRGLAVDESGLVLVGAFAQDAVLGALGARASAGGSDALVLSLDDKGAPRWAAAIGGKQDDIANAVAIRGDRLLAVGNFAGKVTVRGTDTGAPLEAQGAGSDDLFAACFDRAGAAQWLWSAGGRDSDGANSVAATADGWIIGGSFSGRAQFGTTEVQSKGGTDALLVKISLEGEVVWLKQLGGKYNDAVWRVAVDAAGQIYAQGIFADVADWGGGPLRAGGGSDNDVVLAKYDAAGNHLWSKRFGSAFNEVAGGVAVDPAGYVTMTGSFDRTIDFGAGPVSVAGESDVYVARFSPAGELVWAKTFGADREDIGFGIAADASGNVLVSGWFEKTVDFGGGAKASAGSRDVFVTKLDASGKHLWSTSFGDRDHDQARAVALAPDGRGWVAGIYRFDLTSGSSVHSVHTPADKAPPPDIFVAAFAR